MKKIDEEIRQTTSSLVERLKVCMNQNFWEGKVMTLKDISNAPDWIMWVAFVILALMSIVLLTGRGAGLIAGYNTASKSEKSKYDEKKLCQPYLHTFFLQLR